MEGEPKPRSGCIVALYVLFAIGVGGAVLVAGGLYLFSQSERGQQVLQAVENGAELFTTATQAPGTEELRAVGCEIALASSATTALDAFRAILSDEAHAQIMAELEMGPGDIDFVICITGRLSGDEDDCAELAATFGDALEEPPEQFILVKARQGADEPTCQGLYAPDGTLLEEVGR